MAAPTEAAEERTDADGRESWIIALLVDAAREEAAVDRDHFAVDEAGRVRGEEDGGARQLFDLAEALHGRAQQEFAAAIGAVEERRVEVGAEDARRNRVHGDALRAPLDRERSRQRRDGSLARRIR